jgi:hypothetical protein
MKNAGSGIRHDLWPVINSGVRQDNAQQWSRWLCNRGRVLQGQRRVATRVQRVVTLFMAETRPFTIEGHLERSGFMKKDDTGHSDAARTCSRHELQGQKGATNCAQANTINKRGSGWGANLTTHFHLALRLRMSGDIPLLPLYAFMT